MITMRGNVIHNAKIIKKNGKILGNALYDFIFLSSVVK